MMVEVKIKDLIAEQISGEWGDEPKKGEGVFVIRTTNFQNDGKLNLEEVVKREIPEKKIAAKRLQKGDVIIEKSGGSPDQPVGRVVFFNEDTDEPYLTNNFTTILRPNTNKVHPLYFHYLMMRNYELKKVLKFQNRTTGIINLKLERYLNSKVRIHDSINDQITIVEILKKSSNLIDYYELNLKLIDEFLNSQFNNLIGSSITKEKTKQIKLGSLIKDIRYGTSQKSVDRKKKNESTPVLRIPNVIGGAINYKGLKYVSTTSKDLQKLKLIKDDILIVRSNGNKNYIGRCASFNSYKEDVIFASYLIRIRLKENSPIKSQVVSDIINSPAYREIIVRQAKTTAGNYNINTDRIKKLKLVKPDTDSQLKYLNIKNFCIELIGKISRNYDSSVDLFQSILQKAFNDELDFQGLEIEHVIPKSEGGTSDFDNLTITTKAENKSIIDETFSNFDGIVESDDLEPLTEIKRAWPPRETQEDIDQLLSDLDNELKFRKEVPCVAEYIKYRIIKEKLSKSFVFDDLWDALEKTPFVEHPSYDMVRNWVFQEINDNKIKQVFDGRGKKMRLKLAK